MDNMRIIRTSTDAAEYCSALKLRDLVLRKPLGLDIRDDDLSKEYLAEHFIAVLNEEVIGTLYLMPTSKYDYQMKQVAVHSEYQGKSVGKKMITAAEKWATENDVERIWLHARINAWPFYEKLDYQYSSEKYTQLGIVHKTMEKYL